MLVALTFPPGRAQGGNRRDRQRNYMYRNYPGTVRRSAERARRAARSRRWRGVGFPRWGLPGGR